MPLCGLPPPRNWLSRFHERGVAARRPHQEPQQPNVIQDAGDRVTYTVSLNRFTPEPEADAEVDIQAAAENREPVGAQATQNTLLEAKNTLASDIAISDQANLFALPEFPAKADAKVVFHKDDWLLASHFGDESPEERREIPIQQFCDATDVKTANVFTVTAQRKQILNILTTIGIAAKKHCLTSHNEWIALAVRDYPFWEEHLHQRLQAPTTAISAHKVALNNVIQPYPDSPPFVVPGHDNPTSDLWDILHTGNEPLQQQQIYNHQEQVAILIDHVLAENDRLFPIT